jgi:hypothetical protein
MTKEEAKWFIYGSAVGAAAPSVAHLAEVNSAIISKYGLTEKDIDDIKEPFIENLMYQAEKTNE